jgi:hypothetical protein
MAHSSRPAPSSGRSTRPARGRHGYGELVYRSRAEHAAYVATRVAGVIAVRDHVRYDVDDLQITGF